MPCSTYCFSIKDEGEYYPYSPPAPPCQSPPSPPPLLPPPLSPEMVYVPYEEHHKAVVSRIFKNLRISASLIGGFFLFAALVILLHNFYKKWKLARTRRRRNAQILDDRREDFLDENHGPVVDHPIWYIRTVGLQQAIIDSITVCKYRKDEGLIEGTECSVCLSEFEEDESLRLLPKCNHAFHLPCIDQWLRSHKNCPLCRAPIVREGHVGLSEGSSSNSDRIEDALAVDLENQADELGDGDHHQPEESNSPELESLSIDEVPKVVFPNFDVRNGRSRVRSDLVDNLRVVEGDSEPMRRSVSMDSSSASKIYSAMANIAKEDPEGSSSSICLSAKLHKSTSSRRENSSSSIYKMLRKNTISMKRTFSSSRRFESARSSTSQSSIFPL